MSSYRIGDYEVYVNDDKKVIYAVKVTSRNPTTLFPYRKNRGQDGLWNCYGVYTVKQFRQKIANGTGYFK